MLVGMRLPDDLERWIDHDAGQASEALWLAALAMIEQTGATERTRMGQWTHWPRGRVRRLRRDLAHALALARIALELAEAEQAIGDKLADELAQARAQAGAERRRLQTRPAEDARTAGNRRQPR